MVRKTSQYLVNVVPRTLPLSNFMAETVPRIRTFFFMYIPIKDEPTARNFVQNESFSKSPDQLKMALRGEGGGGEHHAPWPSDD